jgi:non-ribosomal peptide synthetase component F
MPPEPSTFVHDRITMSAAHDPTAIAVDSWDGQLTYGELDEISTIVAHKLALHLGVTKGAIVALCFVKSRYMPLA